MEVEKNQGWNKLNDTTNTYEYVDLIIALGSAGVFTAIVSAFKVWLDSKKIKKIECFIPDGSKKVAEGITPEDAKKLGF